MLNKIITLCLLTILFELALSQKADTKAESISTGSLIHLNGPFKSSAKNVLISFVSNGTSYTMGFLNNAFFVTNENKKQRVATVALSKPIGSSDVYFLFTAQSVNVYASCQLAKSQLIGSWSTTLFQANQILRFTGDYTLGNGGLPSLLDEFCSIESLQTAIDGTSASTVAKQAVVANLEKVNKANSVQRSYLPSMDSLVKIDGMESVSSFDDFSISELVEVEARVLIASRQYSQSNFFNRSINDYVNGFSDGSAANFWIGLDTLNKATNKFNFKLRVVAVTTGNVELVEEYLLFKVGNKKSGFQLTIDGFVSQKLGLGSFGRLNYYKFSTYDFGAESEVASLNSGGFWFQNQTLSGAAFCFTCMNSSYANRSQSPAVVSLAGQNSFETFSLKMYLVPSDQDVSYQYRKLSLSDSVIVKNKTQLLNLLEFSANENLVLLYRASRDGFSANSFHGRVDGKPRTLVVVKSKNYPNIFGGYTELAWGSNGYRYDSNAFLYSLVNANNISAKIPIYTDYQSQYAIYDYQIYSATFGGGHDLRICSDSNIYQCSYSNIGHTYGSYSLGYTFLAGSYYFLTEEIEVYQRIN